MCRTELDRAQHQHDPVLWGSVARAWAAHSRPYDEIYARWRQAEALLATGAKDEAAAVCDVRDGAARMGAAP